MIKPAIERRSKKYIAVQSISDYEVSTMPVEEKNNQVEVKRAHRGIVKFFDGDSGWGFVTIAKDKDYFVHHSDLKKSGLNEVGLETGDEIEFNLAPVEGRGPKAVDIKLIATK